MLKRIVAPFRIFSGMQRIENTWAIWNNMCRSSPYKKGHQEETGVFLGCCRCCPWPPNPTKPPTRSYLKNAKFSSKIRWGGFSFFVGRDRSFVLFFLQLINIPPKKHWGLVQVMVEAFWLSCNKPSRMIRWLFKHYDPVGLGMFPGKCLLQV